MRLWMKTQSSESLLRETNLSYFIWLQVFRCSTMTAWNVDLGIISMNRPQSWMSLRFWVHNQHYNHNFTYFVLTMHDGKSYLRHFLRRFSVYLCQFLFICIRTFGTSVHNCSIHTLSHNCTHKNVARYHFHCSRYFIQCTQDWLRKNNVLKQLRSCASDRKVLNSCFSTAK